jgi:curved DNA-binding protein CbpA
MARPDRNYYELLGVPPDASRQEIHSAYRRLARRYHPDMTAGGDARFQEVTDAYEILHDPAQRARYDRSTREGPPVVSRARGPRVPSSPRVAPSPRVPFFSAGPAPRDIPRFLDDNPGGAEVRLGARRGVRVQIVVRWLR